MKPSEQQGNLNMGQSAPQPQAAPEQPAPQVPVVTPTAPPAFPQQLSGLEKCFISPKKAFLAAGGTEQQFAREVNFAMQAMLNNTYLIDCAKAYPDHLIEAIKNVSLTGLSLNPELKLGYLVPYKGKVKFQASYMGKVDILIRTGVVKTSTLI
ncbi:recombinase RecT [Bacteroides sp. CR5/BHMF/2]|nr:recombinase RecT [Bacteroides sp. CR5/BHMF/2]